MHELGIVFHIIDSLESVGRENQLTQVANVTLEIGEVSGVVDSYLKDCWKWASEKSSLLRGAKLITQEIPIGTDPPGCLHLPSKTAYRRLAPIAGNPRSAALKYTLRVVVAEERLKEGIKSREFLVKIRQY